MTLVEFRLVGEIYNVVLGDYGDRVLTEITSRFDLKDVIGATAQILRNQFLRATQGDIILRTVLPAEVELTILECIPVASEKERAICSKYEDLFKGFDTAKAMACLWYVLYKACERMHLGTPKEYN
jgi:hypothetical protein